jgi:hypothetical protein
MFGYDLDTYVDMSLGVTEATPQASARYDLGVASASARYDLGVEESVAAASARYDLLIEQLDRQRDTEAAKYQMKLWQIALQTWERVKAIRR